MLISVNLKRLQDHLDYIERQREEVHTLLRVVHEWEDVALSNPDYNAVFFSSQYTYLNNQMKCIEGRYQVIKCMIERFSEWGYRAELELTDAKHMLNMLSNDSL